MKNNATFDSNRPFKAGASPNDGIVIDNHLDSPGTSPDNAIVIDDDLYTAMDVLLPTLFPPKEDLRITTVILRGLPSAGKSYFATKVLVPYLNKHFNFPLVEIFSADDYFVNSQMEYNFNVSLIGRAHDWCRKRFVQSPALVKVVDNTNSTKKEYQFYQENSKGRKIIVLEICATGRKQLCNDHRVPPKVVATMKQRWEDDDTCICVNNCHDS